MTVAKTIKKPLSKKNVSDAVKGVPDNIANRPATTISEGQVRIGLQKGMTLNMGNYQSARIDMWMERVVPDNEHEVNKAILTISQLLDEAIEHEQSLLLEESK